MRWTLSFWWKSTKFSQFSQYFPSFKTKVLNPGTSLVPRNPNSCLTYRCYTGTMGVESERKTWSTVAIVLPSERPWIREGSRLVLLGAPEGHRRKTQSLFSLSKWFHWKNLHHVNRKRTVLKQSINKCEIIYPTRQCLAWPFHPKPSPDFFPEELTYMIRLLSVTLNSQL